MFFNRRIVEEELERIRKANLPDKQNIGEDIVIDETGEAAPQPESVDRSESVEQEDINLTAKDVFAMIIAAFSIILPYALIFIIFTVLFVSVFFRG